MHLQVFERSNRSIEQFVDYKNIFMLKLHVTIHVVPKTRARECFDTRLDFTIQKDNCGIDSIS